MTILAIILGWLGFALLLAWAWYRLRAHGKRFEAEADKWMGEEGKMIEKKLVWDKPSLSLLIKLGSLIVHADEALSKGGHPFDVRVFQEGLKDPEVKAWIEGGGVYLPLKRTP